MPGQRPQRRAVSIVNDQIAVVLHENARSGVAAGLRLPIHLIAWAINDEITVALHQGLGAWQAVGVIRPGCTRGPIDHQIAVRLQNQGILAVGRLDEGVFD